MKVKYIPVLLIVITIITITGPLLSVTPKQPYLKNSSIESQIAVLYIYGNYTTNHFFTYQSLFSSSLFISLSGINITDLMSNISFLSNYDVLIIGHSSFDTWDKPNSSHSNAILGAGLPILAMGQGGGTFFEGLGYSYGGGAMGFTSSGMIVNSSDASHGVFNQFYSFNVPGTITYTGTSFRGVLMSGHGSNANFLAVDQSFKNHSPLLENNEWSPQKTVYFGINGVPPNDQSNLYKLIHNCLEWLSGKVFTTITEPPTTTETTMTSDQTSSTSSEPTMDPSEPTTSNPETPPPSDDSTSTAGSNENDTSTAETSTTNPILNITPGFSVFLIFCSLVFLVPLRRLMKKY